MSRILSELLGASEPMFTMALQQLEHGSGNQSADIRLTAEIIGKVQMGTRALGLDRSDTTGKELYHTLLSLVAKHDEFLARRIGGTDPTNVQDLLPRIKTAVEKLVIPKKAWVLKHSVAKRLLQATPPKHVMKHLGYKSVDSMIKREPIAEIYAAIRFAEDDKWLKAFLTKYKKLHPSNFETREIELIQLDDGKWGGITESYVRKKRHNIAHLKELGVIVMLPFPVQKMRGLTIIVLPLILHYINEIRLHSAYFKLQQVRPDFGTILVDTLIKDPHTHAVMAGQKIHWRVIQRYFGKQDAEHHPEIFEPHVQAEDLHWRKAEEVLYKMEPALYFWHDMDYVGHVQAGRPVSFNLMDMAVSYVNDLPYSDRTFYHLREALWNEIFTRYLGQKSLEVQVLKQLDNEMIEPELFTLAHRGRG